MTEVLDDPGQHGIEAGMALIMLDEEVMISSEDVQEQEAQSEWARGVFRDGIGAFSSTSLALRISS